MEIEETWHSQIKKGLIELCILNLLSKHSMYGYQLIKVLRDVPGLVVSEGTIYPLIGRMKREGLLDTEFEESPNGPVRKNYQLSAAGRRRLNEMNTVWKEISGAIDALVSDNAVIKGGETSGGKRK